MPDKIMEGPAVATGLDPAIVAAATEGGVFVCNVHMAGASQNDNRVYLWLSGTTPFGRPFEGWYYADSEVKQEVLDTGLTAISAGLTVLAGLTSIDSYSRIEFVYVRKF